MPSREKQIYIAPAPVPAPEVATVAALTLAFTTARAEAKARAEAQSACLKADLGLYANNPILDGAGLPDRPANYTRVQTRLLPFEQSYLSERENWQSIVDGVDPTILGAADAAGTTITLTHNGNAAGTIYLNDARFQPHAVVNTVQTYRLRDGTVRDYVRAANDGANQSYIKRYVVRGLSLFDMWSYYRGVDLTSPQPRALAGAVCVANEHAPPGAGTRPDRHPAPAVGAAINMELQIISHTRGWRKRFISVVPSEREIYSTQGAPFNGDSGVVRIDLVEVLAAGHHVRDVHCIPYADAIYTYQTTDIINAVDPSTPPVATHAAPTGYQRECFKGYRDVLRTREALIDNVIPWAAIGAQPEATGKNVLALGVNSRAHSGTVEADILAAGHAGFLGQVRLNYPVHGAWFVYAVFDSAANALTAYNYYGGGAPAIAATYAHPGWFTFNFYVPQLAPA